jgi:hypothetical protein
MRKAALNTIESLLESNEKVVFIGAKQIIHHAEEIYFEDCGKKTVKISSKN